MKSKLQLVAQFRGLLFCSWLALVIASGLTLPAANSQLSPVSSVLILCSGMLTLLLGVSLAIYLVELWKSFAAVDDRFDFAVSLAMETVAGVPVLLLCLAVPAAGAIQLFTQLISLF